MSNINFLTAHVIYLLSNAKITFSQGGCVLQIFKIQKVFDSPKLAFTLDLLDGSHKCITTAGVAVISVQFMEISHNIALMVYAV